MAFYVDACIIDEMLIYQEESKTKENSFCKRIISAAKVKT
jgi:hypothetical protein